MDYTLSNIEPQALWQEFCQLCKLPHPTGLHAPLLPYLQMRALRCGYQYQVDEAGNLLVRTGKYPRVCLQAHYDMVPQQSGTDFDFLTQPIEPRVVDASVMATGTSLGADNGIGVAAMLALMQRAASERPYALPPMELLFTADEETGMQGARKLSPDWIQAPVLFNLDSEQEGVIMTGCAGAVDLTATLQYKSDTQVPEGDCAIRVTLAGLQGGHSGMDIALGRANAIKLMNRFLKHAVMHFEARLASFTGGTLRNAIPRNATALITVPAEAEEEVYEEVRYYQALYRDEYGEAEPTLSFVAAREALPSALLPEEVQDDVLNAVEACHNGVWRAGKEWVDTSANLARLTATAEGKTEVILMVRSLDEERKRACVSALQSAFLLAGFRVDFSSNYVAWSVPDSSPLLTTARIAYQVAAPTFPATPESVKTLPLLKKVHCGLECGVISEKYPQLQILSFGPTIHHPHSPQESVEIESVKRFYLFLVEFIREL